MKAAFLSHNGVNESTTATMKGSDVQGEQSVRLPTNKELWEHGIPKGMKSRCKWVGEELRITPLPYKLPEITKSTAPLTKKQQIAKYAYERMVLKRQATPSWANKAAIEAMYDEARRLSRGGERFVVDHIIPLKHPLVCGLHVETNLQVIPYGHNARKYNKFDPGF